MRETYLSRTRSCAGRSTGSAIAGRAVRSTRHAVGVSGVLLGPVLRVARGRVPLVVVHLVRLGRVRRVGRIGWARCRDVRIYRHFGVRLDALIVMMVVLFSIVQGHGRTCCLCHTCGIGVTLVLVCVVLTRDVVTSVYPGRRCLRRSDNIPGGGSVLRRRVCCWSHVLLRRVLCGRCWICLYFLGSRFVVEH